MQHPAEGLIESAGRNELQRSKANSEGGAAALAGDRAAIGHRHNLAAAALHCDIAAILPRLKRYARKLTRDPEDADDLVQDCIACALEKAHL